MVLLAGSPTEPRHDDEKINNHPCGSQSSEESEPEERCAKLMVSTITQSAGDTSDAEGTAATKYARYSNELIGNIVIQGAENSPKSDGSENDSDESEEEPEEESDGLYCNALSPPKDPSPWKPEECWDDEIGENGWVWHYEKIIPRSPEKDWYSETRSRDNQGHNSQLFLPSDIHAKRVPRYRIARLIPADPGQFDDADEL